MIPLSLPQKVPPAVNFPPTDVCAYAGETGLNLPALYPKKKAGGKEVLTTSAGRKFILTGDKADLSPDVIYRIKSVITFEGNDERLPELSILSFKPVK